MTRDRIRRTLAIATTLAILGACGSSDGDGASTAPSATPAVTDVTPATDATIPTSDGPPATQPDTTGTADTTPTVDLGDRVVVLAEEFMLADVMALGIRPIASTASVVEAGFQGLSAEETAGIEVLPMTTLSLEHLASLRPTSIITLRFWVDQAGEDNLRAMTDQLFIVPDGLTLVEQMTTLGDMLGRPGEAAAVVADLEAATAAAREQVPDDCRVSLVAIYPGPAPAVFVDGPWDIPTSILATGCALDPDRSVAEPDQNGRVYLSLEQLEILDAPRIVLLQSSTVDGEDAAVDEITSNPLWQLLPAVRADQVVTFDRLGYPGAPGQIRFLHDFAAIFA